MRGLRDDRDRLGGAHGRNAAVGGTVGHEQVPSAHLPDGRLGHLEPGQSGGVRKRPRRLQHPEGASDAGAAAVVDVGPAEGSSSVLRLLHGGVLDAAPIAVVQRSWDVRSSGLVSDRPGHSGTNSDAHCVHRVDLPSEDAVHKRSAAVRSAVETPVSCPVARAGTQVPQSHLHRTTGVNNIFEAARAALCEAWSSTDQLSAPPELSEHLFLYKEARKNYLNKDFSIASEYCKHAKEATSEAVNTGKFSEADASRALFSQIGLLESLIALDKGETADALKGLDMVLLMGTPSEPVAQAADLVAEFLSLDEKCAEVAEPWDSGIENFQGWKEHGVIEEINCPAVDTFWKNHMWKERPVKITKSVEHFPATQKWSLKYLLKVAGDRTVPVELGRDYTHPHWTQQLMPLRTFAMRHLVEKSPVTGYLAQHSLFVQIPRLMDDLLIPDYCNSTPDMNIWLGPEGTVSPLHHDPKHNLLTQVRGHKRVLLFPPDQAGLYPFSKECLMSNTSQVDPESPDLNQFPLFCGAKGLGCLLGPGDVLYIPPKWWHHVRSLTASLSVSFWWE